MIDWNDKRWIGKKGSQLFEELCYEIIKLDDYKNVNLFKGSADSGRDIEALKIETEIGGKKRDVKYWFQCKLYNKGVGLKDISDSLASAQKSIVDVWVLITKSHITPQLKDFISQCNTGKTYRFRIEYLEGKEILIKFEKFHLKLPDISKYISNQNYIITTKKNVKLVGNKLVKKRTPFTSKEESEFEYFLNKINRDLILNIKLGEHDPRWFGRITKIELNYSVNLIEIINSWNSKDALLEKPITIKRNLSVSLENIFNDEILELIAPYNKKDRLSLEEPILKNFPISDLTTYSLLKYSDYNLLFLTKKIKRFCYWLEYNGFIKKELIFKLIEVDDYRKKEKVK